MKAFAKRISLLVTVVAVVGLLVGSLHAEAAVKWAFSTSNGKKKAKVNATVTMEKGEYQDMNLYRNGKQIKEKNATYSVKWYSSNKNVVYIDKTSGKMKADKYGKMTQNTGNAKITAVVTNKKTGAMVKKSFTVEVKGDSKSAVTPTENPTPVQITGPLIQDTTFYVGVFDVLSLSNYYAEGVTAIQWVPADPSLIQVNEGDILGLYPGTTTVTGTYGDRTVTVNINVYNGLGLDDLSVQTKKLCLFPGESYQLLATQKDAVFSSADPSVAIVATDGTVTAVSIGTTTITASNASNSIDCTVNVVADDGTYLKSSLSTEYPLTKERVVMASDSFYLFADIGVYLPDDILEKVEIIMSTMEEETGLSFSNTKLSGFIPMSKPTISVINTVYDSAYGHSGGVVLAPYDIYLDENGTYVLVHELLHTLQLRNGVGLGNALTEGFAIYYGGLICEKLPYPKNHDEYYNEWVSMGAFDEITLANTETSLLNPPDVHPFSYFFVRYLAKTYGDKKIYTIIDAITEAVQKAEGKAYAGQVNPLSEEAIYEIIKEHTSNNLTEGFYRYFSSLEEPTWSRTDLSDVDGVYYVDFTGNRRYNSTSANGLLRFNQEITLDFTYAFDYAEKVWGRKAKGISLRVSAVDDLMMYDVDTTFYDKNGNIIPVSDPYEAFRNVVPGAVKVTLRGVDECICHLNFRNIFGE